MLKSFGIILRHSLRVNGFVKDDFHCAPAEDKRIDWQNYPIVGNGDGYHLDLFFDGKAKGSIFKADHIRRLLGIDSALRVEYEALAFVNRLAGLDKLIVLALELCPVHGDVQFLVHEPKNRDRRHVFIFSHENGIDRIQSHGRDVQVGEVIGTENVLVAGVKFGFAFNLVGEEAKNKSSLCPKSVDNAHPFRLAREEDRNQ